MSSTSARDYGFFHQQYSIFPFRVFHRKEIADCIQDAWTLSHAQDVTCKDERYTIVEPLPCPCYATHAKMRADCNQKQYNLYG
jgi:hypothetical protein